jgi:hypothetical protein
MNIPHKIKIKKSVYYLVAYVPKFEDPNQLGECINKHNPNGSRMILLKSGMSKREERHIFVHELLHAIEFEYGISIPHNVIYALQEPLAEVLLMNPSAFVKAVRRTAKKKARRR